MTAIVIVGAQWGDEGKGKVVDLYTESADLVVRYAGGPNAGHTLVVGGEKLIVRLIPSGILRSNARCVMAQGMVVDPGVLVSEIDAVEARGCSTQGRLFVSDRAHLILPFHPLVDSLREAAAADGVRLGTTKRGIGPCYEDKASRRGARLGDLRDMKRLAQLVSRSIEAWTPTLRALGGEPPSLDAILEELTPLAKRITPLLADTSQLIDGALRRGERVLLEGAQGTLLDIDHGTFPFVTSSSAIAGGACVGAGVGPTRIRRVLGLAKAYCTRVGEGPFPTELEGQLGERLRSVGGEYGSVTGRPRRTGWLDLPALRYAARVNGLDGIALTKLDVLTGMPELKVCVAYDTPSGRTREFPIDDIATAKPVLETVAEWSESIDAARSMTELPAAARQYVEMVEKETGVPVDVVSVGADREATIVRRNAFA
ncbi:adenylosuccinate synthase [Sorangium atrum]|uniref:Adenylosuccinate synthetase n=1 Tax=Sorangium atrum TaxID=2995308 RepID=A0ABT5C198_9BACT|nr:adenylosuccinate synthase [Sorangium aterium]MDC0679615.1 adenylosuccinate synthase [Sorangium aterium]